jgi:hypothetical protein
MDALTPAQRVAFVMHDVFGIPFVEIADILDRSTTACRALASAARRRIEIGRSGSAGPGEHAETVREFKAAFVSGDIARLVTFLEAGTTVLSDGGGEVRAALRPIHGADKVARYLAGVRRLAGELSIETTDVNGRMGLVFRDHRTIRCVVNFEVSHGKITNLWFMFCPTKLGLWR